MIRSFTVLIFPVILFAGSIELSLHKSNIESSYIVEAPEQNLKSKLIFPISLNTLDIGYCHDFGLLQLRVSSSFELSQTPSRGEDFDWYKDELTLYSHSQSNLEKYADYTLEVLQEITQELKILFAFNYKELNMSWFNTQQTDLNSGTVTNIEGKTLEYQQTFYQYKLALNYEKELYKNISLELQPALYFAYIDLKDKHLLRNFYTTQNAQAYGYGLILKMAYRMNQSFKVALSLSYESLSDNNTEMTFYNSLDEQYLILPASYNYTKSRLGLECFYSF